MLKFTSGNTGPFWARPGIIHSEIGNIPTPMPLLTSNEIDAGYKMLKSGLVVPKFKHPIIQVTKSYKEDTLKALKPDTRVCISQQKHLEKYSLKFEDKLSMFHPILPSGFKVTNSINDVLTSMQLQADFEILTVRSNRGDSPELFEKRVTRAMNMVENEVGGFYVKDLFPTVHLDSKEKRLREKLDIISDLGLSGIDIVYASPLSHMLNYGILLKFRKRHDGKIIVMSETPRHFSRSLCSSMPFLLQSVSDLVSIKVNKPPIAGKPYKVIWKEARIFDRINLGRPKMSEYQKNHGNKLGNCDVCRAVNNDIKTFKDVYNKAELLTVALKCHETLSSFDEMSKSRNAIGNGTYRNYVKPKTYLREGYKKLFRLDVNNKTFNQIS